MTVTSYHHLCTLIDFLYTSTTASFPVIKRIFDIILKFISSNMLTVVTKQLDSAVSHEWQKIYDFPKKGLFSPYFDMLWSFTK